MPTIYDILPEIKKGLIDELAEFLRADNGRFYMWEIAVFIPAVNLFIHYLDGVNQALENDNYISTMANVRGLIESLAVVVYDGTANLPEAAYTEYMDKGRLVVWNEKKQKWRQITNKELIEHLESTMQIGVKHVYDHCCDMLHFSSKHMALLDGSRSKPNEEPMTTIAIGSRDNVPVGKQRELIEFCTEASTLLGRCIRSAKQEKDGRTSKT